MSGYTKNIAVIKGLKDGFSADGGALSGLVKAEKYSSSLRVEISLINFAPLTEGRYVAAISDGPHTEIIENCLFEGQSDVDTSAGFAAAVCYVNGGVRLIASAVCGNFQSAAFGLKSVIERAEKIKVTPAVQLPSAPAAEEQVYEDEALAEENYYEFDTSCEGGEPVCQDTQEEENGVGLCEDEKDSDSVEENARQIEFAAGGFYERTRAEIEGLLATYPPAEELCAAIEGSKWVKISYGGDSFYVFGVIYSEGAPRYLCYGIPSSDGSSPPAGMQGLASFLPVKTQHGMGFWVMYQDAETGASIQISPK